MGFLQRSRQIGKTIKSAKRLRTIVTVLAKHGFQNVLEKAKLGRYLLEKFSHEHAEHTAPERLRMAFEELGPTFIKLGQLLATRPDLIPEPFAYEFKRLHDNVAPIPLDEITQILKERFPDITFVFESIEEKPLATASIAQVHAAKLKTGEDVVVKIQKPDILKQIADDLNVMYFIAELIENSVPESRVYNPKGIVDEFFKNMELETNFVIEANNILRFQKNFAQDPEIKIPKVYLDLTTENILVMEMLKGIPLSQPSSLKQEGVDPEYIAKKGMKTFFKMVFQHRYFHGDLHAGNLFILPNNVIGFVDFGVVGRLSIKTRDAIANMFIAISQEDYSGLALEFASISDGHDYVNIENFERDLRDLISPYFGLNFKNVNTGKLLMDSATIAAKHHIQVPSELMLYFKSIITVEGMGREIVKDFDLLSMTIEISQEILKSKYDPQRVLKDFTQLFRDSLSLLYDLPRQIQYNLKKRNQPQAAQVIEVKELREFQKSFEIFSGLVFLGLIIGSLVLAGAISLDKQKTPFFLDLPFVSTMCFGAAIFLSLIAFYNYIRK